MLELEYKNGYVWVKKEYLDELREVKDVSEEYAKSERHMDNLHKKIEELEEEVELLREHNQAMIDYIKLNKEELTEAMWRTSKKVFRIKEEEQK
jgi:cell division protein FtsB